MIINSMVEIASALLAMMAFWMGHDSLVAGQKVRGATSFFFCGVFFCYFIERVFG